MFHSSHNRFFAFLAGIALIGLCARSVPGEQRPFVLRLTDEQSGRGIPLIEVKTTSGMITHTDSAGVVAFNEPGLMNQKVFFLIESPGYALPKDGFGFAGKALEAKPGGEETIRLKRLNIAERLYRITGQGIYHHSTSAGLPVPLKNPNLNGQVTGQDTAMVLVHAGKIHWFWGDTGRVSYPLGHFGTAAATSLLPKDGGLDPSVGVDLTYYTDAAGFSRPMFKLDRPGLVWVHGATEIPDPQGRPRIIGHYSRLKKLGELLEQGMAAFSDEKENMEPVAEFPLDVPIHPYGQALQAKDGDETFVYFATPYPLTRVRARWDHMSDWKKYEGFTPLKAGSRFNPDNPDFERDAEGRLVYSWKPATAVIGMQQQEKLVQSGRLKREEAWIQTIDAADGKPITLHSGSVRWNAYRKKYVLVAVRHGAPESLLGEVYYAESDSLTGHWPRAVKIATHPSYTFYNPVHHDFFDQEGGRLIYFEGTYTQSFSGNPVATPRYEYNQLMYRLDLSDPRLQAGLKPAP